MNHLKFIRHGKNLLRNLALVAMLLLGWALPKAQAQCPTSNELTITVVPDPTITAQPTNIDECVGGTLQLSVTATGGTPSLTYQWQSSPNGTAWTDVSGATATAYTPPSASAGTTYYRVIVSASGVDCASATSTAATVIIRPDITITAQPNNIDECVGGTDQLSVTISGGSGTVSYQWQSSPNGTTWTDVSGATASAYTPPSATAGTTYYRVIVRGSGNGCDDATSTAATVIVRPDITITAQPINIDECVGGTNQLSVTVTGGSGTVSYQWESSPNGTTWTPVAGATAAAYTPPSATAGTTYYRVIVSGSSTGCDNATSTAATVIVRPDITITAQPNNIDECVGGTNQLSVTITGGSGTVSYQWQSSPNGTTWTDVSGATAAAYTPPSATAGTTYYRIIVSGSGNGCDNATSTAATVIVRPDITITAQPNNIDECVGGTNQLSVTVTGGSGTVSYQWQSSPNGTTWTDVSGATASAYTPPSATAGTTYYRIIVSGSGNGCDNATSTSATVIVRPDITISAQPNNIDECVGGTDQLSVTITGGSGTVAYQWESSPNGTTWTPIAGATASAYTPSSATAGTTYYRVVVSGSGNGCDNATSTAATVIVRPDITITAQPNNIDECVGGTNQLSVTITGGSGTVAYQWQSSPNGTTWTDVSGATASAYTPPSATAGTTYYRVIVSGSGNGCDNATSTAATVIVRPEITVTAQPNNIDECVGGTDQLSVTITGGSGTVAYQWESSPNGTTWTPIAGATASAYTPPSATAGTTYYRVVVSGSGNGCDNATSSSATVIVRPDITISAQPNNISECVGGTDQLSVTITGGSGTVSYQWQSSPNGTAWTDVSGATAAAYTPPSTTAGTTYYRVIVRGSGNGCDNATSTSATVIINADPVATVATPPSTTICVGGDLTLNASVTGGVGCSMNWQNSTDNGTTWNDIPSQTGTSYTTPSLNANTRYRVRLTCSGSGCCN